MAVFFIVMLKVQSVDRKTIIVYLIWSFIIKSKKNPHKIIVTIFYIIHSLFKIRIISIKNDMHRIYANSFLTWIVLTLEYVVSAPWWGNYSSFHFIRENLKQKVYKIFKVLQIQKRIVSEETIRGNMVCYSKISVFQLAQP